MLFTVQGTLEGLPAIVIWEDGELSGTSTAVARVLERIRGGGDVWATPTGPHYEPGLTPPEVALVTILDVLDQGDTVLAGDVPKLELEELPEGATP